MRKFLVIAAIASAAILVFAFRLVQLAIGSALYIYLLPGVIAQQRHHPRQRDIYILSAVAGWLILPWIGALLYASRSGQGDALCIDAPLATGALDD